MKSKTNVKFHVMAIIAIVLFCIALCPITMQNDTYYTIEIGEHIVQNGGIDMMDPFSWHQDLKYTYPHWAYDVFIYLVYSVGGMLGIYLSTVALACILGITIYVTQLKISKNKLLSFLITLGLMYIMKDFIAARAQLVTYILFTLSIYFIESFLETKKKRYAIGLVIIPIIIANVHLAVFPFYFVLFIPYIAEYLLCLLFQSDFVTKYKIKQIKSKIGKITEKENNQKYTQLEEKLKTLEEKLVKIQERREKRQDKAYKIIIKPNKAAKWLILIFIICLFTGLLTPLGTTPYTYLPKTMEGNTTQNISEHLPMVLIQSKDALCVIIILLAILMFTDTKIRLRDFFMIGGLLLLTLMQRRQQSMLFIVGAYILNQLICNFVDKYDPEGCNKVADVMTTWLGRILTISIVAVVSLWLIRPKVGSSFVSKATYPVEAAQYIIDKLDVDNIRLYNEYNYGSYLLYRDIPVFIDSRADLYAPEFNPGKDIFSDFINISNINVYYEDKFKEYDITHVIVYNNAKLNLFLSRDGNYKQLYKDDTFTIYQRLNAKVST